jgi:hypothetical protein
VPASNTVLIVSDQWEGGDVRIRSRVVGVGDGVDCHKAKDSISFGEALRRSLDTKECCGKGAGVGGGGDKGASGGCSRGG